jgi:Mor family transcriptional regulator
MEVPRAAGALRALRDHRIVERLDAGEAASLLARESLLTERAIWKIRRRLRHAATPDRRQIDLFSGGA